MQLMCRTQVVHEVHEQVHVDLIRVHKLQHLPSPAAEVVEVGAQVPARGGVPHYDLLEQGGTHRLTHQKQSQV